MIQDEINLTEEELIQRQQAIFNTGKQIHQEVEGLIGEIEEFIELTDGDLKLIIDDIKRLANFLDAVIEVHPITYDIAEVMDKLELDEPTLRQLLVAVGVDIDKSITNPDEKVTYHDLVALLADRAGSREGDLLGEFLRGDSPKIVWG
jgi:uncharacterized membrane protein